MILKPFRYLFLILVLHSLALNSQQTYCSASQVLGLHHHDHLAFHSLWICKLFMRAVNIYHIKTLGDILLAHKDDSVIPLTNMAYSLQKIPLRENEVKQTAVTKMI